MKSFDQKHSEKAGHFYMLLAAILFGLMFGLYRSFLTHIPPIQIAFVVVMLVFIINYFFLRHAFEKPYIEDPNRSFSAKLAGVLGLISILLLFYSMQFVAIETSLTLFFWAAIFATLIEKYKSQVIYNNAELLFGVVAVVGVLLVFKAPFILGGWGNNTRIPNYNVTEFVSEEVELSAVQFTYVGMYRMLEEVSTNVTDAIDDDQTDPLLDNDDVFDDVVDDATVDGEPIDDTPGDTQQETPGTPSETGIPPLPSEENKAFRGLICAIVASFLFALVVFKFKQHYPDNCMTVNHIFSLIVLTFLPIFFPLEGVIQPSLGDWLFMIFFGIVGFYGMAFFTKAC